MRRANRSGVVYVAGMRLAVRPDGTRLYALVDDTLSLYELRDTVATLLSSRPVSAGQWVTGCDACVAVLRGEVGPAGASLVDAQVMRWDWDGNALPPISVGEAERRGISLTADGALLVTTDWARARVTLFDTATGTRRGAAGISIPSGAAISGDGGWIIAGAADQGSGAILRIGTGADGTGALPLEKLPPPKPSPGLDDAPYFSVFSTTGTAAIVTNYSWGGRGVFVYDVAAGLPRWSRRFEVTEEVEPEEWTPPLVAWAANDTAVLVSEPDAIRAYRATDGSELEALAVDHGDGSAGLAVADAGRVVWVLGNTPIGYAFPPSWTAG